MKISELIKKLELVKAHSGDIEVRWESMNHSWEPELLVKKNILVLNA